MRKKVLIVEDSRTQLERLRAIIEAEGYEVQVAGDGEEALTKTATWHPDMVITDIVMPRMDGYELCRQLRGSPKFQETPIIMLTSKGAPMDIIKGLEAGADNFFIKPYEDVLLQGRMQALFAEQEGGHRQQKFRLTMDVELFGKKIAVTPERQQIVALLLSTMEELAYRAEQLEQANAELDAFAYSVAHDLRAPVITVHGFSQMLLEDYASSLPEEAQRYIHEVANGTRRMSDLIDDLLSFSRLGRQPVNKQHVEPADIVHQALAEVNGARAGQEADVRIDDLPPCWADPALLKQVYVNLLSNALKFSRNRKDAVIEVGGRTDLEEPTHHTYFVNDNGAGFDMQYAGKMFRVFQRLHRQEEYEGTGVGLAIVQRIIQRHGGRVWAEGEVGKGATFYFTLPGSEAT
ncbi:MAG TPA: response regulator [bacterium]|nr:response regulator [bacterium]